MVLITKICFLHLIDYCTRFSASCVVYIKRKETTIKKIFEISAFCFANKFLVDNGREFK